MIKLYNIIKKLRVLIAIITIATFSILFLDVYHIVPENVFKKMLMTQLVPSLLSFLKAGAITIVVFLILSSLALLLGRIYCSTLCPLGIFMDIIIKIKKFCLKRFENKKIRFKQLKALRLLPLSILLIVIISLIVGNIQILSFLDPYSNFGRIYTIVFKPLAVFANNLIYDTLTYFDNYTLHPIKSNSANIQVSLFVFIFFGLLVLFTLKKGRVFCTHICPVGTYLGIISKFSFLRVDIDKSKCVSCKMCELECKSGCISAKNKTVDHSRCVMCMNCLTSKCPKESINLVTRKNKITNFVKIKEHSNSTDRASSRRNTIKMLALAPISFAGTLMAKEISVKNENKSLTKRVVPVSPLGSLNHNHFLGACTGCYLCVNACPSNVIKPSVLEYGLRGAMLPQLTNEKGYCNLECTRCSNVCPNGALLPVSKEEKKTLQIGIAHFVREKCVVITDGTDCGACSEHCPTKAVDMTPENGLFVPVVTENICIGCGACEYACPVTPEKAIFVEGNSIHQVAQKPKIEKLDPVNENEEFPF